MAAPVITLPQVDSEVLAARGWKTVEVPQPDGGSRYVMTPLTAVEFLHPQEDYHMPISHFHNTANTVLWDLLTRRYAHDPTAEVFHDLLVDWDVPGLGSHSPDIMVIFGVRNKGINRTRFNVGVEGVRPRLVIEVVSPEYRKEDRVEKLREYELAGVPEYIILDQRRQRGHLVDEALGYELRGGRYSPILPDEQGRVLSKAVGLWISLQQGVVVLEDAATGERLLTSQELADRIEAAEARAHEAEVQAREEQAAREAAEAQARKEQVARETAEAKAREEQMAREQIEQRLQALEAQLRALSDPRPPTDSSP